MSERKPHILIDGFANNEEFQSRRRGRNPSIPPRDRVLHGQHLSQQYTGVLDQYQEQKEKAIQPITEETGIYVEIVGEPDCELPLDTLDTIRSFKLVNVKQVSDQEIAVVFVPESKRYDLKNKIEQFLNPKQGKIKVEINGVFDLELGHQLAERVREFEGANKIRVNKPKTIVSTFIPEIRLDDFREEFSSLVEEYPHRIENISYFERPKNYKLINTISEIRFADLKSFWTDAPDLYPDEADQEIWWELWLKKQPNEENPVQIAHQLAERINARVGNTSQTFFDSAVVLIRASVQQLERAPELIANLEELRRAKETPTVLIESSPKEQHQWAQDLNARMEVEEGSTTAVTILDTGINYNHPILGMVCNEQQAERWHPAWPRYDNFDPANPLLPFNDHGSRQAGLAAFGDLQDALLSADQIRLNHFIESARILPPTGNNDPELYGAITVGTAEKLAVDRPDWNRVYSLAITAEPEREGGQPSSWSAEIDQFSSGIEDEKPKLFVISAGNNSKITPVPDYWDQVHLAQIEDPAQSWNSLTVGAFTEKTTNDDQNYDGWSPMAISGDIAPSSRSAVNWAWRKQAPYKPDVVAEGGNRLLSPDQTEVTDADVVSLLTTSGRTTGQLFESNRDTSAACALVSRQAAILMAEYPDYWPETIRALMVHSASWTPQMWKRFGLLNQQHSPKLVKETMLRTVGHGVPDLERARYSANHALTLIAQDHLQPFIKNAGATESTDPKLNEMQLYQLPWPIEVLQQLPPDLEVKLKVTLSYFIEPNPGRRGYRKRYSYQSHGLRFEVIRPEQSLENFRASINQKANEETEDYDGPEGDSNGWQLGPQLRTRGSLHSDTWIGYADKLANMHTIAVYPVGGWWKYRTGKYRWQNDVRYSLIVSIDVPDENIDIYSVIENMIEAEVEVEA